MMATTRRKGIPSQPKQGITRQGHCRPKTYPTLRTSQEAKSRAKANQRPGPQNSYLKKGFNSKAEYSNTQQDLTVNGYTKPTLARLCRICEGSGVYQLKSNKEQVLIFKFQLSSSSWINHSRFAPSYTNMVQKLFAFNKLSMILVSFLTLCSKGIKRSHFIVRGG